MWILVHNIFVASLVPIWQHHFLAIFSISRFGYSSATEMLCTKIHTYNHFPVDTDGNWCKIIIANMINLISKIFHWSLVANLVVKFQTKLGDPRPLPIWFLWPIFINTNILAPEYFFMNLMNSPSSEDGRSSITLLKVFMSKEFWKYFLH